MYCNNVGYKRESKESHTPAQAEPAEGRGLLEGAGGGGASELEGSGKGGMAGAVECVLDDEHAALVEGGCSRTTGG